MEFSKKLQQLRKQKGLTQEQLAQAIFVSRTAVSKWESGRGYPSIDSLKAIANFFSISVDELLSGEELLTIAQEDHKEKSAHIRDLVFGALDLGTAMLLFLPILGQKADDTVHNVSLLSLTAVPSYLKAAYLFVVIALMAVGLVTVALQNCRIPFWVKAKTALSLLLNILGAFLFIISLQPYAATFLLGFLAVKVLMLIKWR